MTEVIELSNGGAALIDYRDKRRVNYRKWSLVSGHPMAKIDGVMTSLGRFVLREYNPSVKVYYKDSDPCNCTNGNLTRKWDEVRKNEPLGSVLTRAESEIERMDLSAGVLQECGQESMASTYHTRAVKMRRLVEMGDKGQMMDYLAVLSRVRSWKGVKNEK